VVVVAVDSGGSLGGALFLTVKVDLWQQRRRTTAAEGGGEDVVKKKRRNSRNCIESRVVCG
jgi:hypothetical protein